MTVEITLKNVGYVSASVFLEGRRVVFNDIYFGDETMSLTTWSKIKKDNEILFKIPKDDIPNFKDKSKVQLNSYIELLYYNGELEQVY